MTHNAPLESDQQPSQTASAYVPYVPPAQEPDNKRIHSVVPAVAFVWLVKGRKDLDNTVAVSAVIGLAFWVMYVLLLTVFKQMPEYTMSYISGCFLVGPFLVMALYEASRRNALGLPQSLKQSLTCWRSRLPTLGMLVLILMVLELLWGRASLIVFAVFFTSKAQTAAGALSVMMNPENWRFILAYFMVGGFFASLVFAICVVSIPMILDRDTDAITAGFTSLRVVLKNPLTLFVWGVTIVGVVGLAAAMPLGIGIVVAAPLLGYASWHAYRGTVEWLPLNDVT